MYWCIRFQMSFTANIFFFNLQPSWMGICIIAKTDQIFICEKLYLHRHFLFNLQLAGMGIMAKTV